MRSALIALIAAIAAAVVGWTFQATPYRLRSPGYPGDQAVLAHRTSAYSDITWMVAPVEQAMELRFFDRVEGGTCPHPSWAELRALAAKDERLRHLCGAGDDATMSTRPDATWPVGAVPDPGTLTHTKYITLLPVGVMLNHALMAAAGGDLRKASPRVLVVGLGSGTGIATLAHHVPDASITVVDIDREVIDMVLGHYPLLRWLTTQTTSTGEPRLRLVCADARQYIRFDARAQAQAGRPLDLMVFDAYTSGSTIPPHLMTVEFFAQCAQALSADGIFLANIIGSYHGEKHKVLGGAIRSLRHPQCGLSHVRVFPILQAYEHVGEVDEHARNNIVVASRHDVVGNKAETWNRLLAFTPWEELQPGTVVSESVYGVRWDPSENSWAGGATTTLMPWPIDDETATLRNRFVLQSAAADRQHLQSFACADRDVMRRIATAVLRQDRHGRPAQAGWDDLSETKSLTLRRTDWVLHARETFRRAVLTARDEANDGEVLVGPVDGDAARATATWIIRDAPLFTDARPNADIYNVE